MLATHNLSNLFEIFWPNFKVTSIPAATIEQIILLVQLTEFVLNVCFIPLSVCVYVWVCMCILFSISQSTLFQKKWNQGVEILYDILGII